MKYAITEIKGSQYLIKEGDELLVGHMEEGEKPEIRVLLVSDGKDVKIGTPEVTGAKISSEVLGEEKGKKIHVQTYRAKSRYRRKVGHRSIFTRIKIGKITS